jgi:hypothetical protein
MCAHCFLRSHAGRIALAPILLFCSQICRPQDLAVRPLSGPAGTLISITGKGFGATPGAVTFQGVEVKPESWSDGELSVVPPDAGAKFPVLLKIEVKNKEGKVEGTAVFTETAPRLVPSSGPGGIILKIVGPGFGSSKGKVTFGEISVDPVSITSWTDGEVDVIVPKSDAKIKLYMPLGVLDAEGNKVYSGVFTETPSTPNEPVAVRCPSNTDIHESVPCAGPIARITAVDPKKVYPIVADAIVKIKGKYGFPLDIVAAAFGLAPAEPSFALRLPNFSKIRPRELQVVKQSGQIQKPLPALVTVYLVGEPPQILPAEYVRALFLTQLFPNKVRIVTSREPSQQPNSPEVLTSSRYVILESRHVAEAKTSLYNLAKPSGQSDANSSPAAFAFHPVDNLPRLMGAAFPPEGQAKPGSSPPRFDSGPIASWLPQIAVEKLSVEMVIDGNHWECGPWRDIDKELIHPINGKLETVGQEGGCLLNIQISTTPQTHAVYKQLTIAAWWYSEPYACAPADFSVSKREADERNNETGVTPAPCSSGSMRWDIDEDRIAHPKGPPKFQLAVPYFDPNTPPKIMLGMAGVLNVNFIEPRDKSCWCSPNICGDAEAPERKKCEKELNR